MTGLSTGEVLMDYLARTTDRDELARLLIEADPASFAPSLNQVDQRGWWQRQLALNRLVRAEAITYGGSLPGELARPWQVDILPFVITTRDWEQLEAGLRQRTMVLDAILTDLYGPRRLISSGVLPAELVLAHRGFLPAADAIVVPGPAQLIIAATDLVRTDNGWMVLSDRTQSPSGMGYAMANRRLVSRVLDRDYRNAPIRRLRGFYDQLRIALAATAPPTVDNPRIVILSPGPASETAYDQALLAMLIGHPIAQPGDLEISDGQLWLRTTGRRQPVHVVQRRVDAEFTDSLDLRSDSRLGVPGLVQAARQQRVSVANHLGSGVLENAGLLAHLDRVTQFLLGEPLLLPSVPTWWCGEAAGLSHTLAHLDRLVIKPIARRHNLGSVAGWLLDEQGRSDLTARICAEPWLWTSQVRLEPSTVPVVGPHSIDPSPVVLRTFGVADQGSYSFLPGGLARVAPTEEQWVITNHRGALSKDVWVLQDREAALSPIDLTSRRRPATLAETMLPGLPPSAAENLYWLGRYSERAEATARMLKVCDQLIEDNLHRSGTPGNSAMQAMLVALSMITGVTPGFVGAGATERLADPLTQLRNLLLDDARRGCVAYTVDRTTAAAANTRELLSGDTFSVLNALNATMRRAREDDENPALQPIITEVLRFTLAFAGLVNESLVRDATWAFVEAGRRMERAQTTVRMLRHTLARVSTPVIEALLTESVLNTGDSVITYRRRMAAGVGSFAPAEAGLELLLLDTTNPRSVRYQLDRLAEALALAPHSVVDQQIAELIRSLTVAGAHPLFDDDRQPVRTLLENLDTQLRELSDLIERVHFATAPPAIAFAVSERTMTHHG